MCGATNNASKVNELTLELVFLGIPKMVAT